MSNQLLKASQSAAIEQINLLYSQMEEQANIAAGAVVKGVNLGRQLGFYFQELCNHEQMTLEFFSNVSDRLPTKLHFGFVQKCIWLSRNLPEPAKNYAEAKKAEQTMFQAFDLLPEPKRDGAQNPTEESPVSWMLSAFSGIEARLRKFEPDCGEWDAVVKRSAVEQIDRQLTVLNGWKSKLTERRAA